MAPGGSPPEESTFPWMEPEEEEDTGQQGEQVRLTTSHSWSLYIASVMIHRRGASLSKQHTADVLGTQPDSYM